MAFGYSVVGYRFYLLLVSVPSVVPAAPAGVTKFPWQRIPVRQLDADDSCLFRALYESFVLRVHGTPGTV